LNAYTIKDFVKDAADVIILNFIFLVVVVFGLGITFGSALKALFHVSTSILDPKRPSKVFHHFFKSFKEDFWRVTALWFFFALLGASFTLTFLYAQEKNIIILLASSAVSLIFLVVFFIYSTSVLAIMKSASMKQSCINSFYLMAKNPLTSFLLIGNVVVVVLLFLLFSGTVLFSMGLFGILTVTHMNKLLRPYINQLLPDYPELED